MIRWNLVAAEHFDAHHADWDRLNEAGPRTPLLDAALISAALKYFGSGKERLALGVKGTQTVAMGVFCSKRLGKLDMFQPSQLPLGPLASLRGLTLADLSASLLAGSPLHCVLASFTQLDPMFFERPQGESGARSFTHLETGYIDLPATMEQYFQGRPKKKYAQVAKRLAKAETDIGPVRAQVHRDATAMAELVGQFADMESAGWKGTAGSAVRRGGEQALFYTEALEHFAMRSEARVFQLYFGGTLAAMQLAVARGNCLYLLKSSYYENLKDYSPGVTLKKFVVEHLYREEPQIRRVEFYGKLIEPHRMWVNGSREIFHANLYRIPLIARMHDLMRARVCITPSA